MPATTRPEVPRIRRFQPRDYAAVIDLSPRLAIGVAPWRGSKSVHAAVRGWVEESIESADHEGHAMFVAELCHHVVGVVSVAERPHFSGEVDGYVGELITAAGMEGRGAGRALMVAAEDWARHRGLTHLTLETGAQNSRARQFYRHLGYAEEDVRLTRRITADT